MPFDDPFSDLLMLNASGCQTVTADLAKAGGSAQAI
jgi:hypothetical protein